MIGELANPVLIGDPRDVNLNGVVFDRGTTVLRFLLATLSILIHLRGILLVLRAAAKVAIKFINLVNKLR